MVKIINKTVTITGQDNDYQLRVVETKDDGKKLIVTEDLTAINVKDALTNRTNVKKNKVAQINNAREELKMYEVPTTVGQVYAQFKILMKLTKERENQLRAGITGLTKDIAEVDIDIIAWKKAYGNAKQWLKKNKPEVTEILEPKKLEMKDLPVKEGKELKLK